ncbi:hypothetical protein CC78DRAFT_530813 [Lojkania enalia]|uniref:Uncharacterized protein n=1 Tax=Lojkania enalia TaxID=147567 RepID=A0A9P4KDW1_9PLEO|nr:hypothetical protein CC78DRAFT_530813 [Didymosphaeria enalia]
MKSIARIETVLEKHLATLCRRLNGLKERKRPANMSVVFRSLAVDVVTDVSLPESMDLLEMEYLGAAHEDFLRGFTEISLWNRHLLYVNAVFERLRKRLVGMQGETALHLMDAVEGQKEQARRVIAN